ncbi:arginine deiminase-related protein [Pseudoalteromonas piscicida]|uniref:citrulline utilization hydrolase CtlX n=1 Tax=Pseudoalteromonas piscicida TaxID=43662 RepID=UPI0027381C15|nr:arginine deiminase-related protein [Pseudoalteromonas piscicida]MDP4488224.1 arginine deiminase-related protein [Pseudoalteromonas piscicida]
MTTIFQAPRAVVMIRPHHFTSNPQTMQDNAFQQACSENNPNNRAYVEVSNAVQALELAGVKVHLFEDTSTDTPDSVFPNNWFSTHSDGQLIIYPMYALNRRLEIRRDIIDFLSAHYQVTNINDYSHLTAEEIFLEGTGSMVIDHQAKVAYAVESKRTNAVLVNQVCEQLGLEAEIFNAYDKNKVSVYHTNVLMCVATDFAMICLDMVPEYQRAQLINRFTQSGHTLIALSYQQIQHFCGNAIELQGSMGRVLALSTTAYQALLPEQIAVIEKSAKLVAIDIPTIEAAGGSVRCMIAGVHLNNR